MSSVIWHVTMSLDGFIAGRDDSMDWVVAQWSEGGESTRDIDVQRSAVADQVLQGAGAILGGRRWYDVAVRKFDGYEGIYGGQWTGPVFVLTHGPPDADHHPTITFLSDDLGRAVATATAAAAGKDVIVFGANLAQQCLRAGLLDEIVIHLVPVLLGDGVRLTGAPDLGPVALERTLVATSGQVTDLRFAVRRSGQPSSLGSSEEGAAHRVVELGTDPRFIGFWPRWPGRSSLGEILEVGPVPGELTRTDAVLLLVDQQEGLFSRIHDAEATRRILAALARCARLLEVPAVMTTALAGGPNGAQLTELADAFPDQEVIDRTVINAWHDARVREAIRRTGRRQVVIAGTGLDVCARLPALAASAEGFEAYVVIDSCGRFDPQPSIATVSRLAQAGVALVNTRVAVLEMMADNADPRAGEIHATLPAGLVVIDEAG